MNAAVENARVLLCEADSAAATNTAATNTAVTNKAVMSTARSSKPRARQLAAALGLPFLPIADAVDAPADLWLLIVSDTGLAMRQGGPRAAGPVSVDFVGGKTGFRRQRQEATPAIVKAVGVRAGRYPRVWDLTAGLGQDAFTLARYGCAVTLFERHPLVHCLLADGLERARRYAEQNDPQLLSIVERLTLVRADSLAVLAQAGGERREQLSNQQASDQQAPGGRVSGEQAGRERLSDQQAPGEQVPGEDMTGNQPVVISIDTMFPERTKSAKVKKEMQLFQAVVGKDTDADELLPLALARAEKRVVVKRPRHAPPLAGRKPNMSLTGKSIRFDVYMNDSAF